MGVLRRRWFQIFVSGLILLCLVEQTLVTTSNPNYAASIILLGAFLMPITYSMDCLPTWSASLLRARLTLAIQRRLSGPRRAKHRRMANRPTISHVTSK